MGEDPLDFSKNLLKKTKKHYNRKNVLLTILMLLSVCFFYTQGAIFTPNLRVEAKENEEKEAFLITDYDDWYFDKFKESFVKEKKEKKNAEIMPDFEDNEFENSLISITEGYPIEEMAPFIAEYDKKIAGLIVGIAKKESDWGKRSPSKNGKTCYNYWGYKGAGTLGTSMGYGCFASAEEAVSAIGGRISELVGQNLDTPSKMVVWKCGKSCEATGGQAAANKWISDVNFYYNRIMNI
ncbi:MAG: hypothetical protein PHH24_02730 [Candidatus Moranbacteria bacterium]|jgi:hypothetical protein|nr:hypothetical protein [Candidatus Moranbacteria bacterium]MDX9855911.1 hypothetical protein [Candidatus Moranbacteria bacterium]